MDNTPVIDDVVVPKKNVLFEVTPASRVLASVLFITLPFIGGWIGYMYGENGSISMSALNAELKTPTQTAAPEPHTQKNTTPEKHKENWLTASAMADGKEITIQYPKEIPVDVAVLEENRALGGLGIDPGVPNYTLPLTDTNEIVAAELTTDLKYIFYLKRDVSSNVVTLYKGTVSSKIVDRVTDFNPSLLKDNQFDILLPQVYKDYIYYNSQFSSTSDKVVGNISNLENNTSLFVAPCAFSRFGNSDLSPDESYIIWNCDEDGLYISDWKNTKKILEFSESSMVPTTVSFMNNERIKFANAAEGNDMLRAPYRSIKIDGTDLRLEEGDVYLGF